MHIVLDQAPPVTVPRELTDASLINVRLVCAATGFKSATSIYQLLSKGMFPEPVRLSSRCIRWRVRDVRAWLEAQGTSSHSASAQPSGNA